MTSVFIASNTSSSGKTLLAIGLALALKDRGHRVGYLKPFGRLPVRRDEESFDDDALFVDEALDLKEPYHIISPVVANHQGILGFSEQQLSDAREHVLSAYRTLKSKDLLLLGGGMDLFDGSTLDVSAIDLVRALKSKVLIIEQWRGMATVDTLLGSAQLFGKNFLGAVINKAADNSLAHINDIVKPFLKKRGVQLFGVFKKDRLLEAVTVRRLIDGLGGEVICCERAIDEFIENFVIGAMDPDNALKHFSKIPNKAVITGSHRTDILLAALETSTRCIIITGGLRPSDMVIGRAISKGIPVISVTDDTFSAINNIETLLNRAIIREAGKVRRAWDLVEGSFDIDGFTSALKL